MEIGANRVVTLYLEGEIDLANASDITASVDSALALAPIGLQLDLAGVVFLGSSGLNSIINARKAALAAGVTFAVVNPSRQALRILEVTALTGLLLAPDVLVAKETFPLPAE
ncbi:MAG: hypothetical protein JWN61_1540 [Pseudonocardiales bacterium]|nr:hypothetical protein [Jatrophihabitantaceae bacterium]MCW2603405.1 hypothetical protein [Pseudonocardiales bacterium]